MPEAPKSKLQGAELNGDLSIAVEEAFDYRGDVTIHLRDGERVEGYLFDRDTAAGTLRVMSKGRKQTLRYDRIERVSFTGRDMADGRSWEAWVRKYAERKAAGETGIELVPEAID